MSEKKLLAKTVMLDGNLLSIILVDGRRFVSPISSFPRLVKATAKQRARWRLIGGGVGVHWPDIDEDLAVAPIIANATLVLESRVRFAKQSAIKKQRHFVFGPDSLIPATSSHVAGIQAMYPKEPAIAMFGNSVSTFFDKAATTKKAFTALIPA